MVPGLSVLPEGAATDHVKLFASAPDGLTEAENCTCVPIVAVEDDGDTVIVGVV
jgi:hypothetical protein